MELIQRMGAMVDVEELSKQVSGTGRRAGGREGRRATRSLPAMSLPTLVRKIPVYDLVPDEAVALIHEESCKILEEVGCEFRDPEAIAIWKQGGGDVTDTRVRIDRGLLMELIGKIPPQFRLNARNPARSVDVGGNNTVFVPMYGAPYVRDLDNRRRYGSLSHLQKFQPPGPNGAPPPSGSPVIFQPLGGPRPEK